VRIYRYLSATLFLLLGLGAARATDLNVVLLDSATAHALRHKLVCILFPAGNPADPIVTESRQCQRTDSGGTATFKLPDPPPEKVDVELGSDGLVACYDPHTFTVADAMKVGMVAKNTCGDANTDTTQTGELVLFGHQMSVWEALKRWGDEF